MARRLDSSIVRTHGKYFFLELSVLFIIYLIPLILSFQGVGDNVFVEPFNKKDGSIYYVLIIGGVINCIIFVGNVFFLIPKFLAKRRYSSYFIRLVIFFLLISFLEVLIRNELKAIYDLPSNLDILYNGSTGPRRDISGPPLVINFVVLIFSFVYRFCRDWIIHERNKQELLSENLRSELKFLRSQINPHFLFNTLNNIFAIAKNNDDNEAAAAISKLSDLMRYMINTEVSKVPIKKELEYLNNLIEIHQLRLEDEEMVVDFQTSGPIDGEIPPMILIPIIENALKFGTKVGKSSIIKVITSVEDGWLYFYVENPKFDKSVESSGIGLENVKRRLELSYNGKYEFKINDLETKFTVELNLQL